MPLHWKSASTPNTAGPLCQLYPTWPPAMPPDRLLSTVANTGPAPKPKSMLAFDQPPPALAPR